MVVQGALRSGSPAMVVIFGAEGGLNSRGGMLVNAIEQRQRGVKKRSCQRVIQVK